MIALKSRIALATAASLLTLTACNAEQGKPAADAGKDAAKK